MEDADSQPDPTDPALRPPAPSSRDGNVLSAIWRHRVMAAVLFGLCVFCACVYILSVPPVYRGTTRLLITQIPAVNIDPEATRRFLRTQCELIQSMPVVAMAIGSANVEEDVDAVRASLRAELDSQADVVDVSVTSGSAEDAAKLANQIVASYQSMLVSQHSTAQETNLGALEKAKQFNDAQMSEARRRLEELGPGIGASSPTTTGAGGGQAGGDASAVGTSSMGAMSIEELLAAAHGQAAAAESAYERAAGLPVGGAASGGAASGGAASGGAASGAATTQGDDLSSIPSEDELDAIKTERDELRHRLSDMQELYLPAHPLVKAAQGRMDELSAQYISGTRRRWLAASRNEAELARQAAIHRQESAKARAQQEEYEQLQSDVSRLAKSDSALDEKISQVDLSKDAQTIQVVALDGIIKPPKAPIWPRKTWILLAGAIGGLALGLGSAVARDRLDPRFQSVESVKNALGLAVLGAIPEMHGVLTATARGQKVSLDPASDVAEAFRGLRTTLQFGALGKRMKTFVITSAHAGDGKTTLVSNLAITLAQGGRRVVILDGDARNPSLHQVWAMSNKVGWASVLSGGNVSEVIQRSPSPNLDVIPVGPAPKDPYEALNDPVFAEMLDELADRYDVVLLDAPPVLAVSDARVLAALCEASILVARVKKSDRRTSRAALEALTNVGATVIGVAVNDVASVSPSGYGTSSPKRRLASVQPSPRGLTMQEMGSVKRYKPKSRAGRSD